MICFPTAIAQQSFRSICLLDLLARMVPVVPKALADPKGLLVPAVLESLAIPLALVVQEYLRLPLWLRVSLADPLVPVGHG